MGKLISVYGPDGSGKTTLAYALANELASGDTQVLLVHTDFSRPVLPERIPELQDALSLGQLLLTGDRYNMEDSFVPYPKNSNVFVTGILHNENFSSYPASACLLEAAKKYFETVSAVFDFVIVDSTDDVSDNLALAGLAQAGAVVELVPPNIQGVLFSEAYGMIFDSLHTKEKTLYTASKCRDDQNPELIEHRLGVRFSARLPYSSEVDAKAMSGGLIRGCAGKEGISYEREISRLRGMVA